MAKAIVVENVSKQYRLGQIGTGALTHDINRWWHRVRGKEDPYLKIGETNDRTKKGSSDYVWSLRDIDFQIEQGDSVGIIGRNGAGKSTLLKILSRVTAPTTGSVKVKGRIASLLEVGTGFHPELSGRDNIFLNGAILGMRKHEIKRKFDEIVDFAGVERYIDTPVKRYSSGMYVRLAFAVAAHLESEILIVDEVLAVGDAEFQKKCLGKMNDVSNKEGRTILFVSHNMAAIQKLCKSGIYLYQGKIKSAGTIQNICESYIKQSENLESIALVNDSTLDACVISAVIKDEYGNITSNIPIGRKWNAVIRYQVNKPTRNLVCAFGICNLNDTPLTTSWQLPVDAEIGIYEAEFKEDLIDFAVGTYKINLGISQSNRSIQYLDSALQLSIVDVVDKMNESLVKYESSTMAILNPMTMKTKRLTTEYIS